MKNTNPVKNYKIILPTIVVSIYMTMEGIQGLVNGEYYLRSRTGGIVDIIYPPYSTIISILFLLIVFLWNLKLTFDFIKYKRNKSKK